MGDANTYRETLQSPPAPYRGPSAYQSRSQYYEVLNHFFFSGRRVKVYARFKRIGDKRGWGPPEWTSGLELDRQFFFDLDLTQVGARLAELVLDGCEVLSYKKHPAPGGKVTYLLISWATNAELERNRSARVLRKQPKQKSLPRSITPFQHPNPRHTAEPIAETRQERALRFKRQNGTRPSTCDAVVQAEQQEDMPLFAGVRQ